MLYLQDVVDALVGAGAVRVILPITDPYVANHGALGSFATVYLPPAADRARIVAALAAEPEDEAAMEREEACARFELPPDRVGDVVVLDRPPQGSRNHCGAPRPFRLDQNRCARTAACGSSACR